MNMNKKRYLLKNVQNVMKKLQRRYILKVMHIYTIKLLYIWFGFMVFNATFNNISVIS